MQQTHQNQIVYFGGSRNLQPSALLGAVVSSVLARGASVHVGCQTGADQQVIQTALACGFASRLSVFVVETHHTKAPAHVIRAGSAGARVVWGAGNPSAPIKARYLLRSVAAFQGCSQAVFFQPGPGSLAVAREATRAGLAVSAFSPQQPAPVPSSHGVWCSPTFFAGFECFGWGVLHPQAQPRLF